MKISNLFLVLLLSMQLLFAQNDVNKTTESNVTENNTTVADEKVIKNEKTPNEILLEQKRQELILEQEVIDKELKENNIWSKIYSNYHTYQDLKKQKILTDGKIARLEKENKLSKKAKNKSKNFTRKRSNTVR